MGARVRYCHLWLAPIVGLLLGACSSQVSSELPRYREPHRDCVGLNVSFKEFDVDTLRRTLLCLNSGGSLENFAKFTASLNHEEWRPVVSLANSILGLVHKTSPSEFLELFGEYVSVGNSVLSDKDGRAWIEFIRKERTSGGRSFFLWPFDVAEAFGFGNQEYNDLRIRFIGSADSGGLNDLLRLFSLFLNNRSGDVLRPLMNTVGPVLEPSLLGEVRRVFSHLASFLRKPELPVLVKYVKELGAREPYPVADSADLRGDIDITPIMVQVGQQECIDNRRSQTVRAREIIDDYENAVTTWDLKNGRPRLAWGQAEFRNKLAPLLDKIADPEQNAPEKSIVTAILRLLHYFTIPSNPSTNEPPGPNDPRRNKDQHYTAEYLARWLRERSDDYRLIPYFYPGEAAPRLKLVNTLDAFEIMLISSDFVYKFARLQPFGNKGHEFLTLIGSAWGDESSDVWPDEIRQQYPNPRPGKAWPMTLMDAYIEIERQQSLFEKLAGPPKFPECYRGPGWADSESTAGWVGLVPQDIKARLFNIRQVLPLVYDNLPRSGKTNAGGLKVLRDMFFELYTSTPSKYRNNKSGWKNNLNVITRLAELGLVHQVSRNLRHFPAVTGNPSILSAKQRLEHSAIIDFFKTVSRVSELPEFPPVLEAVFMRPGGQGLFWKVIDGVFGVMDSGNPADTARMKELTFYAVAQARVSEWVRPTLKTLIPVLHENEEFLLSRMDDLGLMLSSSYAATWARALYEDQSNEAGKAALGLLVREWLNEPSLGLCIVRILKTMTQDKRISGNFNLFRERLRVLLASADFNASRGGKPLRNLLHIFEEMPGPGQPNTAAQIREFLAYALEPKQAAQPSDFEELLRLIAKHPDDIYQFMKAFSEHVENNDFDQFIALLRRSLAVKDM